jgi:hypothetical protein
MATKEKATKEADELEEKSGQGGGTDEKGD